MRWLCTDEDTDRVAVTIGIITPGIWLGFAVGGLASWLLPNNPILGILGIAVALFTTWFISAIRKKQILQTGIGK